MKREVETGMMGPKPRLPGAARSGSRVQKGSPPEPLGKRSPADPWVLDSWPLEQQVSVALSPLSLVLWCGGPRTLTRLPYPCRGVCGTSSRCQVAVS